MLAGKGGIVSGWQNKLEAATAHGVRQRRSRSGTRKWRRRRGSKRQGNSGRRLSGRRIACAEGTSNRGWPLTINAMEIVMPREQIEPHKGDKRYARRGKGEIHAPAG
jgi:hypothetical protein